MEILHWADEAAKREQRNVPERAQMAA
jgi:hypothetical protein